MPDTTPSGEDAEKFCGQCELVHKCWSMNLAMFEFLTSRGELVNDPDFLDSPVARFLEHHMKVSSAYTLLQIAKLHDRPVMGRQDNPMNNLAIRFFTGQDIWLPEELDQLNQITNPLEHFYQEHIKPARDKILAHNDLETFRKDTLLGAFPERQGEKYLSGLAKLSSMIWKKWDCRLAPPYQHLPATFDFSPDGQTRRQLREDTARVVDCIHLGYRELERPDRHPPDGPSRH